MKERFRLEGAKELDEFLGFLGPEVATKIGVEAARGSAAAVRDALIEGAPYDPSFRRKSWRLKGGGIGSAYYGHLRENIRARRVKSRNSNYVGFNVTTGKAFWGYFLEFGTAMMRARPWARPLVDRMAKALVDIQIERLAGGITRAARRRKSKMLPNGRAG